MHGQNYENEGDAVTVQAWIELEYSGRIDGPKLLAATLDKGIISLLLNRQLGLKQSFREANWFGVGSSAGRAVPF